MGVRTATFAQALWHCFSLASRVDRTRCDCSWWKRRGAALRSTLPLSLSRTPCWLAATHPCIVPRYTWHCPFHLVVRACGCVHVGVCACVWVCVCVGEGGIWSLAQWRYEELRKWSKCQPEPLKPVKPQIRNTIYTGRYLRCTVLPSLQSPYNRIKGKAEVVNPEQPFKFSFVFNPYNCDYFETVFYSSSLDQKGRKKSRP